MVEPREIVLRDAKSKLVLRIESSPLNSRATISFLNKEGIVCATLCGYSLSFNRFREGVSQVTYFGADNKSNLRLIFRTTTST